MRESLGCPAHLHDGTGHHRAFNAFSHTLICLPTQFDDINSRSVVNQWVLHPTLGTPNLGDRTADAIIDTVTYAIRREVVSGTVLTRHRSHRK